jgi:hypothetical protein
LFPAHKAIVQKQVYDAPCPLTISHNLQLELATYLLTSFLNIPIPERLITKSSCPSCFFIFCYICADWIVVAGAVEQAILFCFLIMLFYTCHRLLVARPPPSPLGPPLAPALIRPLPPPSSMATMYITDHN